MVIHKIVTQSSNFPSLPLFKIAKSHQFCLSHFGKVLQIILDVINLKNQEYLTKSYKND